MRTTADTTEGLVRESTTGLTLKDYYVWHDALILMLAVTPMEHHVKFRRYWKQFQELQRANSGPGCTIQAFLKKKRLEKPCPSSSKLPSAKPATAPTRPFRT